jgi:hypothetical protein
LKRRRVNFKPVLHRPVETAPVCGKFGSPDWLKLPKSEMRRFSEKRETMRMKKHTQHLIAEIPGVRTKPLARRMESGGVAREGAIALV